MGADWGAGVIQSAMEGLKIIAFATLAAIVYGILHDQVTAHLCVEYFTIAHPPVFPTESPFWLAIGWGVIATWWVGLSLGILLAAVCRFGSRPKLELADIRQRVIMLMIGSAGAALLAGIAGAVLVRSGIATVPGGWEAAIAPDSWVAFSAAAWAHTASYAAGTLGGLFVVGLTVVQRFSESNQS